MTCQAPSSGGPFILDTLNFVDCQAQTIGEAGYRALAFSNSGSSPLLTLAMTIFVAIIGYRLLIGDNMGGREIILGAIKVGIVLLIATSWPAFRTLVYDVTLKSPANLALAIGGPTNLPGSNGDLAARLQTVDNAMAELVGRGSGPPDTRIEPSPQNKWIVYDPLRSLETLQQARIVFETSSIAAIASVRLFAGLLLALAPIFALFLLFEATRGFFEGWIRALVGAILAGTASMVILGVELALLEPLLSQILEYRRAGIGAPNAPMQILVTGSVFVFVLLAALLTSAKLAYSVRFPPALIIYPERVFENYRANFLSQREQIFALSQNNDNGSRTQMVVDAVAVAQRRENTEAKPAIGLGRATLLSEELAYSAPIKVKKQQTAFRRRKMNRSSAKSAARDLR
jgi:type IV secretion system protein VirB6